MAKAANESTPSEGEWLPLDEAFNRIVQQVRSAEVADVRIRRLLEAGQWRGESFDGTEAFDGALIEGYIWRCATLDMTNCAATFEIDTASAKIEGGRNFYAKAITWIDPDTDESSRPSVLSATTLALKVFAGIAFIQIFLPTQNTPRSNKEWIVAEMKRLKSIPSGITELSRQLETALARAAETNSCLNPIDARSIENRLRELELWPIRRLK